MGRGRGTGREGEVLEGEPGDRSMATTVNGHLCRIRTHPV